MSATEIQELARAASMRDLAAARKLVHILEREQSAPSVSWTRIPTWVRIEAPQSPRPLERGRERRCVVVPIPTRDLPRAAYDAWVLGSIEGFGEEVSDYLASIGVPASARLIVLWPELHKNRCCLLLEHPSFRVVPDNEIPPDFVPPAERQAERERILGTLGFSSDELVAERQREVEEARRAAASLGLPPDSFMPRARGQ